MVTGVRIPLTVDLGGMRVAISRAGGGIGRVMADSFVDCGARVFISDVDPDALASCGHPGMRADAGVPADCEAFVDAAMQHLGGLDVRVNNAGISGPTAPVEHVTPEALDATLRTVVATRCAASSASRTSPIWRCISPARSVRRSAARRSRSMPTCKGRCSRWNGWNSSMNRFPVMRWSASSKTGW
jgi:NAD(P)-dependent dehydrogenase (short-subunit alcohol dehydrogenase family)